jgi:hypothetical protein
MGLSLEFYAGDPAAIAADFTAFEFEGLRNGRRALAYADFSLHLSPTDLDILSEVIAERVGVAPLLLNDSLIRNIGGIVDETGAELVDPTWVRMVARTERTATTDLTGEWIRRVGAEYGQSLEVSPEAIEAVDNLVTLCQLAVRQNVAVVHTWYL